MWTSEVTQDGRLIGQIWLMSQAGFRAGEGFGKAAFLLDFEDAETAAVVLEKLNGAVERDEILFKGVVNETSILMVLKLKHSLENDDAGSRYVDRLVASLSRKLNNLVNVYLADYTKIQSSSGLELFKFTEY